MKISVLYKCPQTYFYDMVIPITISIYIYIYTCMLGHYCCYAATCFVAALARSSESPIWPSMRSNHSQQSRSQWIITSVPDSCTYVLLSYMTWLCEYVAVQEPVHAGWSRR